MFPWIISFEFLFSYISWVWTGNVRVSPCWAPEPSSPGLPSSSSNPPLPSPVYRVDLRHCGEIGHGRRTLLLCQLNPQPAPTMLLALPKLGPLVPLWRYTLRSTVTLRLNPTNMAQLTPFLRLTGAQSPGSRQIWSTPTDRLFDVPGSQGSL
jgi:hypothetical protein